MAALRPRPLPPPVPASLLPAALLPAALLPAALLALALLPAACSRSGFGNSPDGGAASDAATVDGPAGDGVGGDGASAGDGPAGDGAGGDGAIGDGPGDDGGPPDGPSVFTPVTLPTGGALSSLSIQRADPDRLYVLGRGGRAFRSTDRATRWNECARPPNHLWAEAIAVAPTEPAVYLAAGDEVYRSDDDCASWQGTGFALEAEHLVAFDQGVVLATTGTQLQRRAAGAWSRVLTPLDGYQLSVLVSDATGQWIYIGSWENGIARSNDGGTSWQIANSGLTSLSIFDIELDPAAAQTAFAATTTGLFHTGDGGEAWTYRYGGPVYAVGADFAGLVAVSVPGGLRTSIDGGENFASTDRRTAAWDLARAMELTFDGTGRLYAVTDRGLLAEEGGTWAWTALNWGIEAWTVYGIAVPPADPGRLHLSTRAGVLRSVDGGGLWTVQTAGFPYISKTWGVALDPGAADVVYACGESLLRSDDRGLSFVQIYKGGEDDNWGTNVVRASGTRVYVGTETRLAVSLDGGTVWTPRVINGAERRVRDLLLADSGDPPLLLVATSSGVFSTDDDGASFAAADSGLSSRNTYALARGAAGELFVGTADGVFTATGPGATWTSYGLQGQQVRDLLLVGGRLIAASYEGVFFADAAHAWSELPGLARRWPQTLALDHQGQLLVGTDGHGLHRTTLPP